MKTLKQGDSVTIDGSPYGVKSKCAEDDGHWFCGTCRTHMAHNRERDEHLGKNPEHAMVWICHDHGPEEVAA